MILAVSCTVSAQFISGHRRTYWTQQRLDHITTDFMTFCTDCHFIRGLSTRCVFSFTRVYVRQHQSRAYLSELCISVATSTDRSHLRSAVQGSLVISYCMTKRYGQRSFGTSLCNSLPLTDRDPSISLTQLLLRTTVVCYFCRAYDTST